MRSSTKPTTHGGHSRPNIGGATGRNREAPSQSQVSALFRTKEPVPHVLLKHSHRFLKALDAEPCMSHVSSKGDRPPHGRPVRAISGG